MGCLGLHIALTNEQRVKLLEQDNDDDRIDYVVGDIEGAWDEKHLVQTDKAWDAIHRCLSDFPPNTPEFYPQPGVDRAYALPEDYGTYPLKVCVLGGKKLMDDESRHFLRLIEPNEVIDAAAALEKIDEAWLAGKYWTHCEGAWPEYGEEDVEYTWAYFQDMRDFFRAMSGNGRAVLFTAPQ